MAEKVNKLTVYQELMDLMDTLKDGVELTTKERVHLNKAYNSIYNAWEGN